MTKAEKKRFIKNLTKAVAENIIDKVVLMPDGWDGIELRMLLAEKFASEATFHCGRARRKEFRNFCFINNL